MKRIHLLLAIVIISWIASTANAQSVADLARQERQRKQTKDSKAVLTNSSAAAAKAAASGNVSVANPPEPDKDKDKGKVTPGQAKSATPAVQTDNKGRDEKYWRATFETARQEVKRAEGKLTVLDLKMNDLTSQLYREGVYTKEMEIRKGIADTEKQQQEAREEVAASQKKLSDLEDELRRSGGPPGWAR